jgi:hypothetical protein
VARSPQMQIYFCGAPSCGWENCLLVTLDDSRSKFEHHLCPLFIHSLYDLLASDTIIVTGALLLALSNHSFPLFTECSSWKRLAGLTQRAVWISKSSVLRGQTEHITKVMTRAWTRTFQSALTRGLASKSSLEPFFY